MRKLFGLATLFSLFLACGLIAQEGTAPAVPDSTFYPLKKDTIWTYKVGNNSIQMKVTDVKPEGAKLETIVNGKSVANEQITITKEGIFRSAINGVKADKPVMILQLPPKKDSTWNVDTKIQGQSIKGKFVTSEEEVSVPLGKYKTVVSKGDSFEIAGMSTKITYWFAENVGIVKLEFELGGMKALLELEKFEQAK